LTKVLSNFKELKLTNTEVGRIFVVDILKYYARRCKHNTFSLCTYALIDTARMFLLTWKKEFLLMRTYLSIIN